MRLILVRHPATRIAAGVCYGSSDIAVEPTALNAALITLAATLPPAASSPLPIYSSPLQRCTALSTMLAAQRGMPPPRLDARLAEMDFGAWELQPWEHISRADIDAWAADLCGYAPGGGETVLQVATRVAAFVDALRGDNVAVNDAIVVCHAGTIRLLTALQQAMLQGAKITNDTLAEVALRAAATAHHIDYAGTVSLQF